MTLSGFGRGLGKGLGKGLLGGGISAVSKRKPSSFSGLVIPKPPTQEPRRRLQPSPLLRRRGPRRGPPVGQSFEESRAAQDVQWNLPQRIVLQALRKRQASFLFSDDSHTGGDPNPAGWSVDFLILLPVPALGLDVVVDENHVDRLKPAVLQAAGYRYGYLLLVEVLSSDAVLEERLDALIGRQAETAEAAALVTATAARAARSLFFYGSQLSPNDLLSLEDLLVAM